MARCGKKGTLRMKLIHWACIVKAREREREKARSMESAGMSVRRFDSGIADQKIMFMGMQDVNVIFGLESRQQLGFRCEEEKT